MFGKAPAVDTFNVLIVFVIMLGLLVILPLGLLYYGFVDKNYKRVGTYLGGGNIDNITSKARLLRSGASSSGTITWRSTSVKTACSMWGSYYPWR